MGTALGSYKLLGKAEVYVSVSEDGKYETTADFYYTLADKYQWKRNTGVTIEDAANHNNLLVEQAGAKPFWIKAYFEDRWTHAYKNFTTPLSRRNNYTGNRQLIKGPG